MITTKAVTFQRKLNPYEHQRKEFEQTWDKKIWGLLWEMGTGKSKVIVETSAKLYLEGEIDGVLIISDKGCYRTWHDSEIEKHLQDDIDCRLGYWSSKLNSRGMEWVAQMQWAKDDVLDFLCMNIESMNSDRAYDVANRFLAGHYAMIVIDEATSIKNRRAARTQRVMDLRRLCEYRRIMTGTPITQSPMDVWSIFEFLREGCLGFKNFTAFQSYYCQTMLTQGGGGKRYMQILGYNNLDELKETIRAFSSRVLKDECLDLPDKVYEVQTVEQTREQHEAYQSLKRMAVAQFEQGLLTATLAITTINKLRQINCGHVKLDDGKVIDIPSNRVDVLLDLLELLDEKVVIWCAFQRDVELILHGIRERFKGKWEAVDYYGQTRDEDRKNNLYKFANIDLYRWFVGTAATGGKGINELVVARYMIYYSNTFDLEDRLQSEDRGHRIGQKRKLTIFDFVCPGTVDGKVLTSLRNKRDLAATVLDDFKMLVEEQMPGS